MRTDRLTITTMTSLFKYAVILLLAACAPLTEQEQYEADDLQALRYEEFYYNRALCLAENGQWIYPADIGQTRVMKHRDEWTTLQLLKAYCRK
jgi:hypothetical protein